MSIRSGHFPLFTSDFEQTLRQIISFRVKTFILAIQIWWHQGTLKEENVHKVDMCSSKTLLLPNDSSSGAVERVAI